MSVCMWRGERKEPTCELGSSEPGRMQEGRTGQCEGPVCAGETLLAVGLPRYVCPCSLFEGRAEICFRALFIL